MLACQHTWCRLFMFCVGLESFVLGNVEAHSRSVLWERFAHHALEHLAAPADKHSLPSVAKSVRGTLHFYFTALVGQLDPNLCSLLCLAVKGTETSIVQVASA